MEEADSSKKSDHTSSSSSSSSRRVVRRRAHARKPPSSSSCFMDMAEARREIVNALHLHRTSLWSTMTSSASEILNNSTNSKLPFPARVVCKQNSNGYYQVVDAIPNVAEPIWSTTAPAVLCGAVPPVELVQFEWCEDNVSSSYAWWMGFLESLDGKMENIRSASLHVSSKDDHENKGGSDGKEVDHEESPFTNEWLIFPHEEHGELDDDDNCVN